MPARGSQPGLAPRRRSGCSGAHEACSIAAIRLSRVIGRLRTRTPSASNTALAIAAVTGPWAASPAPTGSISGRWISSTSHVRYLAEAKDRVFGPSVAGDALPVEADAFLQDPTRGLDRAAFDLVDDAIGIDGFTDIDRDGQLPDADILGALDLGDHGAIGAGVLVARKADAVTDARLAFPASSSRALRRRGSHPCARSSLR